MKHQTVPAVVEALLEGRARIESGWCKGFLKLETPECLGGPQYCARGAVGLFSNAAVLLQRALPAGFGDIASYNDFYTTTQADILALYDQAIEIALAQ